MYYFAYGSNLNLEHMRRLCGWHFSVLGVAQLAGYEFGADKRGFATVRQSLGKQVSGVLYEIDKFALEALDEFEGYPDVFGRAEVEVKDHSQKTYMAQMYLEPAEQFGGQYIRDSYVKMMIMGARENHMPETWINFLTSFSHE